MSSLSAEFHLNSICICVLTGGRLLWENFGKTSGFKKTNINFSYVMPSLFNVFFRICHDYRYNLTSLCVTGCSDWQSQNVISRGWFKLAWRCTTSQQLELLALYKTKLRRIHIPVPAHIFFSNGVLQPMFKWKQYWKMEQENTATRRLSKPSHYSDQAYCRPMAILPYTACWLWYLSIASSYCLLWSQVVTSWYSVTWASLSPWSIGYNGSTVYRTPFGLSCLLW